MYIRSIHPDSGKPSSAAIPSIARLWFFPAIISYSGPSVSCCYRRRRPASGTTSLHRNWSESGSTASPFFCSSDSCSSSTQFTAPKATDDISPHGWLTERRLFLGLAYGLVLFFGLNHAVVEMVIWSHINGYLLFVILVLGASLLCSKVLAEPEASLGRQNLRLVGTFLLCLVSAFTYEIGQFFAVIAGGVLGASAWGPGRRFRALAVFALFASILPLYQGINLLGRAAHPAAWDGRTTAPRELDRAVHPGAWDGSTTTIWERAFSTTTLKNAIRYVLYTTVQPFFPAFATWADVGDRLFIPEVAKELPRRHLPPRSKLMVSLGVVGALLVLTLRSLPRLVASRDKTGWFLVVLLPFSLFVLHAGITVLGRMNVRSNSYILGTATYFAYASPSPGRPAQPVCPLGLRRARSAAGRSAWVVSVQVILLLGLLAVSIAGGLRYARDQSQHGDALAAPSRHG